MNARIFLFFAILVLSNSITLAQDTIRVSKVKINNQFLISSAKSVYISNLGQPNSTKVFDYETEDLTVERLTYNQSTFSFSGDEMITFSIRDNSISVNLNNTSIKVGDNIATLQNIFPNSYNSIFNTNNASAMKILLEKTYNGETYISDDWLSIGFNQATGAIESIHFVRP